MSITLNNNGRLGNQIIRNIALSIIAEKNDLHVEYSNYNNINNRLGVTLFIGKNKYSNTTNVTDYTYLKLYKQKEKITSNLNFMRHFFQTKEIINIVYNYLLSIKENIKKKNLYNHRYENNNDIFLHIRLHDARHYTPGINYYDKCIQTIKKYDNIYISSDELSHNIIKELKKKYPKVIFINCDVIDTIQFASTCKHLILSHGTYSAIIGYLGFFSDVYYPNFKPKWCSFELFLNKGFNGIEC
jgi:hypothetical protein